MVVNGIERDYIVHNDNEIKGFFGDYRFLSNFHISDVIFEGDLYPSSENAYQAAKCVDLSHRKQFMDCSPAESKRLSKTIVIRDNWHLIRYEIMANIVFDKYYRNIELRHSLVDTKQKYLEETNHWSDTYWGVCNDRGENKLGKIQMGVRAIWNSK
jgi:ribA/ribD-fused uncharacterized protein